MMHNLKGQSTVMELKASIIYDLRVRNQDWAFKMLALSQSQTQLTKGRYNGMDDGVEATMYLHLPYSSSQSVSRKYVYMHCIHVVQICGSYIASLCAFLCMLCWMGKYGG